MDTKPRYVLYTAGNPNGHATFYVGRVPDGRGVVAGECWAGLLVIRFDPSGKLLDHHVVPLQPETGGTDRTGQIQAWLRREGFRPERIEVEEFTVDEPAGVGISDYPWGLEPPSDPTDPDVRDRVEFARQWDEDGGFVVHWGGANVWMDKHGGHST
jgi:hypothetical protein